MTRKEFYKSDLWSKFRAKLMLERVNADGELICEDCGQPITKAYDCIGHHEVELTDENVNDYSISLNPKLVKLIHFKCHNKRHQRFDGFTQSVYLVYGPPCAGKSTYVRSIAAPDDLILDIDLLWEAICTSDKYHKPGRLKANAFGLRDCMIDQIRTRTGMWRNAFIIGGYPLGSDRERLMTLLGAEPVFIDTDKDTCLQRAANDEWREFIEEWFDAFTA